MTASALRDGLQAQALGLPVNVDTDHGRLLVMSWETGRLHRLLAGHPGRRIEAPEWAIPSFEVIEGRAIPLPITPPRPPSAAPRSRGEVRLEEALPALTAAGCRPLPGTEGRWRALCPVCMLRGRWDRRVVAIYRRETATVSVHCFSSSHSDNDLRLALGIGTEMRTVALQAEEVE